MVGMTVIASFYLVLHEEQISDLSRTGRQLDETLISYHKLGLVHAGPHSLSAEGAKSRLPSPE